MTPHLHGIHHSSEESQMNSNWSSGLTVWDLLHGTLRRDVAQDKITIGIADLLSEDKVTFQKMLAKPFQN